MLRGGPAVASVVLCSVCLLVVLSRPAASPGKDCSKDLVRLLESLQSCLKNQTVNITLYTPTIEDYRTCPRSTFTCFADEMKVLQTEMELSGITCPQLPKWRKITKGLKSMAQQSDCRACELHQEEGAEHFVNSSITILHWMNSENCGGR